jgi:hypothetical protein
MTGIPCAQTHSAITFHGHHPEDYVDPCYSIEMYKKAYAPLIYPMPSEEQWIQTERKARVRGLDESRVHQNPYKMRKFGLKGRCGLYKVVGHNTRTCPKKEQASNYRKLATEVYLPTPSRASLPTPPTPSVSFTKQYVCIVFDVLFDL